MSEKKSYVISFALITMSLTTCLGCAYLFTAFFNFNGLYGQDSFEYLSYGLAIFDENSSYFEWPLNYPLLGFLSTKIIHTIPFSFQFVSILSFWFTGFFLFKWIQRDFKETNSRVLIFLILLYGLSPYTLRFGLSIMSDSLCSAFIVMSLYFSSSQQTNYRLFALICASLSIGTRYASIVVLVIPIIQVVVNEIKAKRYTSLLIGISLSFMAFLPTILLKQNISHGINQNNLLESWSLFNALKTDFVLNGYHSYSNQVPNIFYYVLTLFHAKYFFIGLPLLGAILINYKRLNLNKDASIYIYSILLYLVFISGVPFQNARFLLLIFPIVLYLAFPLIRQTIKFKPNGFIIFSIASIFLLQIFFITKVMTPLVERVKLEKMTAHHLDRFSHDNAIVYTSGLNGPLRYYCKSKLIKTLHLETVSIPNGKYYMVIDSAYIASNRQGSFLSANVATIFDNSTVLQSMKVENWTIYELEK